MKTLFISVFLTGLNFFSFAGDILTLNNQQVFDGKVTKIKDCSIVFLVDGEKYHIPAEDIFSIEFEDPSDKIYTDYLELTEDQDKCLKGRLDGQNYHGKKGGHFVLGFLFGPFAMIGTAIASPTPDKGRKTWMLSRNKDLFNDPTYLKCYRKKAKGQLLTAEAIGWAAWLLIAFATNS